MEGIHIQPLTTEEKLQALAICLDTSQQEMIKIVKLIRDCGWMMKRLDERLEKVEALLIKQAIEAEGKVN